MRKILYTSAEVRMGITRLFSSKKRRVAISAFVGDGADAYLPNPKGIELFCWPREGGTNPNAIRKLIKLRAKVYFSNSLHMKIYWTQDRGVIITSANLSINALGAGKLKEIGILLESKEVDIDRVINSLGAHRATKMDILKLDRLHNSYLARNMFQGKSTTMSFSEWRNSVAPSEWKLGWWDTEAAISLKAREISKTKYNTPKPYDYLGARPSDYQKDDSILTFGLKNDVPSDPHWMYVDFIVRVPTSENSYNKDYPCEAVQTREPKHYPTPFRIDRRFRNASRIAIREYGTSRIRQMKTLRPSRELLDLIWDHY